MNTDELYEKEQLTWKRTYEYVCLFCKKKRKTRRHAMAKSRMCSACRKKKLQEAEDLRQMKMF